MSSPRVAYLLKKFPRLSETFVLGEILAQEELGRELHVFSRRAPDDEPRHPQLERLRAEVEVLPRPIDPWRLLFGGQLEGRELFERLRRTSAVTRSWDHPRLSALINEALYLLLRCRRLGIEHVHTHFATDSALVALLLHRLGGPSYSLTVHAKDIYRRTVDPRRLEQLFRGAEMVVTVCDANVRHLESLLSPAALEPVRRLYNGIDLETFSPTDGEREPDHVLAVGRLVEKKGFDVLLEALALLERRGVAARATIVGDGEARQDLERRIAELDLGRRVRLAGPLDQAAVRRLMARATVFCLPCVIGADGNRDALPTVLLEALASGLPSISTPVTGIPEILGNGAAGVLVPENDPAATAGALAELLADPDRRRRLARAGRRRAAECFDLRASSRTLYGWFEQALEPRHVGAARAGGLREVALCASRS